MDNEVEVKEKWEKGLLTDEEVNELNEFWLGGKFK